MRILRDFQISENDILHVYWQCTDKDKQYLLYRKDSKELYLELLLKNKRRFGILLYDYALMDNHQHLLIKIRTVKGFSRFLQCVNTAFAKHINKVKQRTGAVVKDRCKVSVIDLADRGSLVECQAYFHLNRWACAANTPPEQYRYCGYGFYGMGQENELLDISPEWYSLANTDEERREAFKAIVKRKMEKKEAERTKAAIMALDKPPRYMGDPARAQEKTQKLYAELRAHLAKLKAACISYDIADQPLAGSVRENI